MFKITSIAAVLGLLVGTAYGQDDFVACFIHPNPLSNERYVVVVTANDEEGYGVWAARGPSDDYILGYAKTVDGKQKFAATAHGCFDNQWGWTQDGCAAP